jgi:hypothetical protein
VENETERMAPPGPELANVVTQLDLIVPAPAPDRARVHGEYHRVALAEGTTADRVCMRGRCSVNTNSPPSKSSPG